MRRALFALLLCASAAAQTSPLQWVHCPLNGHLYALTAQLSWTDADLLAQANGGHLATVRDAAENTWLANTFATGLECLWIGLNDAQVESSFVWASGEPVVFTNWASGEPTNGQGIEDWCHLSLPWSGTQLAAQWNDSPNGATSYGWPCRGIVEVASLVLANYAQFGAGCVGPTAQVPALDGVAGEPPRIGTTSRIRVSNLPTTVTIPVFVLGLSNTIDPGPPAYTLPADLGVLGWVGCQQLVSDDVATFEITTAGQADYSLVVPMNLGLAGFTFYAQAFVLYSPSGVALSNGVVGTVGF
jgi:hypothetical protein